MARALMVLALVAPLGGCWIVQPCGSQGCPPAAPVSDGLYAIDDHGREDLVVLNTESWQSEARVFPTDGTEYGGQFSPDAGTWLAFGSNRNNGGTSDTNVFIAEWAN